MITTSIGYCIQVFNHFIVFVIFVTNLNFNVKNKSEGLNYKIL